VGLKGIVKVDVKWSGPYFLSTAGVQDSMLLDSFLKKYQSFASPFNLCFVIMALGLFSDCSSQYLENTSHCN